MAKQYERQLVRRLTDANQVSKLMKDWRIYSVLKQEYPVIREVFDQNPVGTVKLLLMTGAIGGACGCVKFQIPYSDKVTPQHDGSAVWREYKKRIIIFLSKFNSDSDLDEAREAAADHIWTEYYRKLPTWPDIGKTNTVTLNLIHSDALTTYSNIIIWSIVGSVIVEDTHLRRGLLTASITSEDSDGVELKAVKINKKKCKAMEADKTKMIQYSDACTNVSLITMFKNLAL